MFLSCSFAKQARGPQQLQFYSAFNGARGDGCGDVQRRGAQPAGLGAPGESTTTSATRSTRSECTACQAATQDARTVTSAN